VKSSSQSLTKISGTKYDDGIIEVVALPTWPIGKENDQKQSGAVEVHHVRTTPNDVT
jgi:hypothetical protein